MRLALWVIGITLCRRPRPPRQVYYSWPLLQADVQATCTVAANNCTLAYVTIDDWRAVTMAVPGQNYSHPGDVVTWGHWVYADAPLPFRKVVEEWMESAPFAKRSS